MIIPFFTTISGSESCHSEMALMNLKSLSGIALALKSAYRFAAMTI